MRLTAGGKLTTPSGVKLNLNLLLTNALLLSGAAVGF